MSRKLIVYIFGNGRRLRIQSKNLDSHEFFYGYFYFLQKYKNVDIVEMNKEEKLSSIGLNLLLFIDKVLRKLSNLPFYLSLITSLENYRIIKRSSTIISTNDRLAISVLPMILITKIFKKTNLNIIVMGLFNKNKKNNLIRKFLMYTLFKSTENFIFLGKGEYDNAIQNYPNYDEKFHFLPFCIDSKFWKSKSFNEKAKGTILFLGNDGNRDFDFAKELAERLENLNFKFVTSHKYEIKNLPKNVEYVEANWNENILSDKDIRNHYENALLTIVPLKESLQPSGQSVALQSMAMSTPVLITKTTGFWDKDRFINNENIIFLESNNLDEWILKIQNLLLDTELTKKIGTNSRKIIEDHYDIDIFNKNLEKIVLG